MAHFNELEQAALAEAQAVSEDRSPIDLDDKELLSVSVLNLFREGRAQARAAIEEILLEQDRLVETGAVAAQIFVKVAEHLPLTKAEIRAGQLALLLHHYPVGFDLIQGAPDALKEIAVRRLSKHYVLPSGGLNYAKRLLQEAQSYEEQHAKNNGFELALEFADRAWIIPWIAGPMMDHFDLCARKDVDPALTRRCLTVCLADFSESKPLPLLDGLVVLANMLSHHMETDDFSVTLEGGTIRLRLTESIKPLADHLPPITGEGPAIVVSGGHALSMRAKDSGGVGSLKFESVPPRMVLAAMTDQEVIRRLRELSELSETSKNLLLIALEYFRRFDRFLDRRKTSKVVAARHLMKIIERECVREDYTRDEIENVCRVLVRAISYCDFDETDSALKLLLEFVKKHRESRWTWHILSNLGGYRREWVPDHVKQIAVEVRRISEDKRDACMKALLKEVK